jgi:hypothetical protein
MSANRNARFALIENGTAMAAVGAVLGAAYQFAIQGPADIAYSVGALGGAAAAGAFLGWGAAALLRQRRR